MECTEQDIQKRHLMYDKMFAILDRTKKGSVPVITAIQRFERKRNKITKLIHMTTVVTTAVVDYSCFAHVLMPVDQQPQQQQRVLTSLFQCTGTGLIEKDEFTIGMKNIYTNHLIETEKIHALTVLFHSLDIDGGGTLTKEEISESLSKVTLFPNANPDAKTSIDAATKNESTFTPLMVHDGNETYSMQSSLSRFPTLLSCLHPRNFNKSMSTLDRDGDGEITLSEFLEWVELTERDAIEKAKYVPPLEDILQLEESSVEGLWRLWKTNFLPSEEEHEHERQEEQQQPQKEKKEHSNEGQFIRLILHKLRRDLKFKAHMKEILPLDVYESIRDMLMEVLVPASWSRFRRQKRLQWGKVSLYQFIEAVDQSMVLMLHNKKRKRLRMLRKILLPVDQEQ
jgi:Ca2+-binding EF-hand superfamily protein